MRALWKGSCSSQPEVRNEKEFHPETEQCASLFSCSGSSLRHRESMSIKWPRDAAPGGQLPSRDIFYSVIQQSAWHFGPSLRADLSALFSGTSQRSHQNVLQFSLDHHIYWTSTSFVASRQFLQFLHSIPTDQTTRTYRASSTVQQCTEREPAWPSLYSAGCGQMNKRNQRCAEYFLLDGDKC